MDLFVRETHHRMKNMLTLLGAWLRADFMSTASVDLPQAIDGFERRILAFGNSMIFSQDILTVPTHLLVTTSVH